MNMKMPTIVGIFILIRRENFMLSWVEHEKKNNFYNLDAWNSVTYLEYANSKTSDQTVHAHARLSAFALRT